jgi:predicted glutamine amidotransferase
MQKGSSMCELLGLCFNQPVRPEVSFRGFRRRAQDNPDGWGIARFEGPACQVFKEPLQADKSALAEFLCDCELLKSTIFVAHVRDASVGKPALKNTHPFVRVFRRREVVLAHNGTLHLDAGMLTRYRPVGDTDSEMLLCLLLGEMSQRCIRFDAYQAIEQLLQQCNRYGTMNVLFSEGEHLYAYTERTAYQPEEGNGAARLRNGLFVVRRRSPFGKVRLEDEDWRIDLDEEKDQEQTGVVIATRPLTSGEGENWERLSPGTLTVFKQGRQVYPPVTQA